ncbi:hypothetical protein ES703_35736 [subsurface metagenome]
MFNVVISEAVIVRLSATRLLPALNVTALPPLFIVMSKPVASISVKASAALLVKEKLPPVESIAAPRLSMTFVCVSVVAPPVLVTVRVGTVIVSACVIGPVETKITLLVAPVKLIPVVKTIPPSPAVIVKLRFAPASTI